MAQARRIAITDRDCEIAEVTHAYHRTCAMTIHGAIRYPEPLCDISHWDGMEWDGMGRDGTWEETWKGTGWVKRRMQNTKMRENGRG